MSSSRERSAAGKGLLLILVSLVAVSAAFAGGVLTERSSARPAPAAAKPASEAVSTTVSPAAEEVFVYGDSLVVQAEPYLAAVAKSLGMRVTVRGYGGIAPCDAEQWLADDVLQQHPNIVVLAFSGNSLTDCMRDERSELRSGDGLVAKYRDDLERSVSLATQADVPVVLASPPASENRAGSWERLDAMYRDLAAAPATRAVHQRRGRYRARGNLLGEPTMPSFRCPDLERRLRERRDRCICSRRRRRALLRRTERLDLERRVMP